MTATPPEAMAEYSRGPRPRGDAKSGWIEVVPRLIAGAALLGAALLIVAEFTTLFSIHSASRREPLQTVMTGTHNAYAMVPIGALAVLLAAGALRSRGRTPLVAMLALGVVALLIALVGDLPDAQASGVYGSIARGLVIAKASPSLGLYLETLGSVLVIVAGGSGLLLGSPGVGGDLDTRSVTRPQPSPF